MSFVKIRPAGLQGALQGGPGVRGIARKISQETWQLVSFQGSFERLERGWGVHPYLGMGTRGPQDLVHGCTYHGKFFWVPMFDPQPELG